MISKKLIKNQLKKTKTNLNKENLELLLSACMAFARKKKNEDVLKTLKKLDNDLYENGILESERIFNFVEFLIE